MHSQSADPDTSASELPAADQRIQHRPSSYTPAASMPTLWRPPPALAMPDTTPAPSPLPRPIGSASAGSVFSSASGALHSPAFSLLMTPGAFAPTPASAAGATGSSVMHSPGGAACSTCGSVTGGPHSSAHAAPSPVSGPVTALRILIPGAVVGVQSAGYLTLRIPWSRAPRTTLGRLKRQTLTSMSRKRARNELGPFAATPLSPASKLAVAELDDQTLFGLSRLDTALGADLATLLDEELTLDQVDDWQNLALMLVRRDVAMAPRIASPASRQPSTRNSAAPLSTVAKTLDQSPAASGLGKASSSDATSSPQLSASSSLTSPLPSPADSAYTFASVAPAFAQPSPSPSPDLPVAGTNASPPPAAAAATAAVDSPPTAPTPYSSSAKLNAKFDEAAEEGMGSVPTSAGAPSAAASQPEPQTSSAATAVALDEFSQPILRGSAVDICICCYNGSYIRAMPDATLALAMSGTDEATSPVPAPEVLEPEVGPLCSTANWACFDGVRAPALLAARSGTPSLARTKPTVFKFFQNLHTRQWLAWRVDNLSSEVAAAESSSTSTSIRLSVELVSELTDACRWTVLKGPIQYIVLPPCALPSSSPAAASSSSSSSTAHSRFLAAAPSPSASASSSSLLRRRVQLLGPLPSDAQGVVTRPPPASQFKICFAANQGVMGRIVPRTPSARPLDDDDEDEESGTASSPPLVLPRFFVLAGSTLSYWVFPVGLLGGAEGVALDRPRGGRDYGTLDASVMQAIERRTQEQAPAFSVDVASVARVVVQQESSGGSILPSSPRFRTRTLRLEYALPSRASLQSMELEVPSSSLALSPSESLDAWVTALERKGVPIFFASAREGKAHLERQRGLMRQRGVDPLVAEDFAASHKARRDGAAAEDAEEFDRDDEAVIVDDDALDASLSAEEAEWRAMAAAEHIPLPQVAMSPFYLPPASQAAQIFAEAPGSDALGAPNAGMSALSLAGTNSTPALASSTTPNRDLDDLSMLVEPFVLPRPVMIASSQPHSESLPPSASSKASPMLDRAPAAFAASVRAAAEDDEGPVQPTLAVSLEAPMQQSSAAALPLAASTLSPTSHFLSLPLASEDIPQSARDSARSMAEDDVLQFVAQGHSLDSAREALAKGRRGSGAGNASRGRSRAASPAADSDRSSGASTPNIGTYRLREIGMTFSEATGALSHRVRGGGDAGGASDADASDALSLASFSMSAEELASPDARLMEVCLVATDAGAEEMFITASASANSSSAHTLSLGPLAIESNWIICELPPPAAAADLRMLRHSWLRSHDGEPLFLCCDAQGSLSLRAVQSTGNPPQLYVWRVHTTEESSGPVHQYESTSCPGAFLAGATSSSGGAAASTASMPLRTVRVSTNASSPPLSRFRISLAVVQGVARKRPAQPSFSAEIINSSASWPSRFFVLSGLTLRYYRSAEDAESGDVRPSGVYSLHDIASVACEPEDPLQPEGSAFITLNLVSGKRVQLQCDSLADAMHIVQSLGRKGVPIVAQHAGRVQLLCLQSAASPAPLSTARSTAREQHGDSTERDVVASYLCSHDGAKGVTLGPGMSDAATWSCVEASSAVGGQHTGPTHLLRNHRGAYLCCAEDGTLFLAPSVTAAGVDVHWLIHRDRAPYTVWESALHRGLYLASDPESGAVGARDVEQALEDDAAARSKDPSAAARQRRPEDVCPDIRWRECDALLQGSLLVRDGNTSSTGFVPRFLWLSPSSLCVWSTAEDAVRSEPTRSIDYEHMQCILVDGDSDEEAREADFAASPKARFDIIVTADAAAGFEAGHQERLQLCCDAAWRRRLWVQVLANHGVQVAHAHLRA